MTVQIISRTHFLLAWGLKLKNFKQFISGSHQQPLILICLYDSSTRGGRRFARPPRAPDLVLGTIQCSISAGQELSPRTRL